MPLNPLLSGMGMAGPITHTHDTITVEDGFKWRVLASDALIVDSIEKRADGIMNIPPVTKPIIYFALDNTKRSPKPRCSHKMIRR